MTIHKEGYPTILLTLVVLGLVDFLSFRYISVSVPYLHYAILAVSFFLLIIILQFFRHPSRNISMEDTVVLCPADGKVVVIEETEETEFLKGKRIQVSIFMSPLNVHVNRYPVSGEVIFSKYHPGLYLVAWHPKSSTDNERTSVVIRTKNGVELMLRQIAGALARRIVCYPKEGWQVEQGKELGFIKFGSRVDLFLPLNAKINVRLNQKVRGGETIIAYLA